MCSLCGCALHIEYRSTGLHVPVAVGAASRTVYCKGSHSPGSFGAGVGEG
jgi:hypothetical protein